MMKYDPQEARALAREAKIEAVRSRLAEEAQEASRSAAEAEKANKTFVQDQLEFADSVYARFQKRLLAHISEGYFNKYGDLANPRTVDVMYLLKHKPREAHLDELVYERYDALSDFLTKNPSWDGTVNEKLRDHPGLAAVLRALRKDGFVPRVYEHDQYDHEGGYDGRRFLDWSGIIVEVEIPSTGADHKLFVKKAERGLANQARKLVREIPARAVEELTEGKKTLEVIAFDRDQGFRHRQDYRFWKHGDFVDPGVEVLRRALEQDPFFGKVLEGIAKLGMTATLEDGAIMVKI